MNRHDCSKKQNQMREAEELWRQFQAAVKEGAISGDYARAQELKKQLEEKLKECREGTFNLALRRRLAREHGFTFVSQALPGGIMLARTESNVNGNTFSVIGMDGKPVPDMVGEVKDYWARSSNVAILQIWQKDGGGFLVLGTNRARAEIPGTFMTTARIYETPNGNFMAHKFSGDDWVFVDKNEGAPIYVDSALAGKPRDFSEGSVLTEGDFIGGHKFQFLDIKGVAGGPSVRLTGFRKARGFSEGKAAVQYEKENAAGKRPFLFIGHDGKQAVPGEFSAAKSFSEGAAAVRPVGSDLWRFINEKGEYLFEREFVEARSFSSGCAWVKNQNSKWDLIDMQGNNIVYNADQPHLDAKDGMGVVVRDDRSYLVDTQGRLITGEPFDHVDSIEGGVARVRKDGKTRYIDILGNDFPDSA